MPDDTNATRVPRDVDASDGFDATLLRAAVESHTSHWITDETRSSTSRCRGTAL